MFMRNLILLSVVFLLMNPPFLKGDATTVFSTSDQDAPIGSALTLSGISSRTDPNGFEEEMASQAPLFRGETIKTQNDSILEIRFTDGSILNMGPKSAIAINHYAYDPNMDFGKINISILRGVYRFTKGRIRVSQPDDIKIDFPAGTISVHDAIVLGQVVDKRSVIIMSGAALSSTKRQIIVKNRAGSRDYIRNITEIGYGSVIEDENFAPTPALKIPPSDIEWLKSQFIPKQIELETKAAEEESEKEKKFHLQAIVHDGTQGTGSKFVVVGGRLYQENDIVDNYRILEISPTYVKCKNMSNETVETITVETVQDKKKELPVAEKITVESIFYDADTHSKSFAYINNGLYREGETVFDRQILEIRPTTVVLLKKGAQTPETFSLITAKTASKTPKALPVLQSIAYDQDYQKRFATINGKTYREGENVDGDLLFSIQPDAIWLKNADHPKPIKIFLEKGTESEDETPRFQIQVILYDPGKSQVAIGGILYRTGDIVDGYEILEVRKSDIRLRKKGRLPWKTHILKA